VTGLEHVRLGEGEPLLLVHSLGGSKVMWNPVLDRLAAEREVIAVDMPGFGGSPPLPAGVEPSAANLARAILDFYETLEIGAEPHLAGISLGGWVAVEAARMGRARSATGLCSAGFWREPLGPKRNIARAMARLTHQIAPLLMRSDRIRTSALAGQMRHPERVSRADAVALVRGYARASGYSGASELMRSNMVGSIDDIEAPVTLAWAEFDTLVRRTPIRALEGVARQRVLPGCGHIPTWDDPELITRVILDGSAAPSSVTPGAASGQ
jgi:pimeloyl-ACP methyl ester carboxylesterase